MDVHQAIATKRAVRQFSEQPLSEQDVVAILDAGRHAQSSKNDQPWRFIAVRDRSTLTALAECGTYAGHLAGAALGIALVAMPGYDFDIGQAAAYMQLAAWERGIGSCIASIYEPEKAKAILGVPAEMQFSTALSFGFPARAEVLTAPPRKGGRQPLEAVVRWERFGE
jgi:nitroreductase